MATSQLPLSWLGKFPCATSVNALNVNNPSQRATGLRLPFACWTCLQFGLPCPRPGSANGPALEIWRA